MKQLILLSLLAISPFTLAETSPQLRSGGQYEANLRVHGVPQSTGMVYATANSGAELKLKPEVIKQAEPEKKAAKQPSEK